MLASFDHPNVVKVYDAGQSDGVWYIVLELIQGQDLSSVLRDRRRLPVADVRAIVEDLAAALDAAHRRGLVHRDVKPSNIALRHDATTTRPRAVLLDFGIAKALDARTMVTSVGALGTIGYMAPEQILASSAVDHRADIYAVGVLVYEMLTGELPFRGTPAEVMFAHLQRPPVDPTELVPEVPSTVSRSVLRALAKEPQDRFQSARQFAIALSDTSS
jgi:serine/threonine-protein kinase